MARYDDILRDAAASAPWEARSVNGAQHDRVDWFAAAKEGFPFPITRLSDEDPVRENAEEQGAWGYFEVSGQVAAPPAPHEENRWRSAATPLDAGSIAALSLKPLVEAAERKRARRVAEAKPDPAATPAADASDGSRGLTALGRLAALSKGTSLEERRGSNDGGDGASAIRRADGEPDTPSGGLTALARLRDAAASATAPAPAVDAQQNAIGNPSADERDIRLAVRAEDIPVRENAAPEKPLAVEQRIVMVGIDDPFAACLLRGCLLASTQRKRVFPGLEDLLSEKDLEDCAGAAYLSYALCSAEGWSSDPNASQAEEAGAVASASLGAIEAPLAPGSPLSASDARMEGAFVVMDFVGSLWVGDRLPSALRYAADVARCIVVLAEPSREDAWKRLTKIFGILASEAPSPRSPRRSLGFFAVDDRVLQRSRSQQRFLRAWWRWFGNGSRWGFYELSSELDRAMGLLGFNLHQQAFDLGLASILASQIRDGGTIASADDIADALADRFPNRELLQMMVDVSMELLVSTQPEIRGERVLVPSESLLGRLEERANAATWLFAVIALRSSPSLQTLLRLEGGLLEVRFSTLFACLAARWFLNDPSRSLLNVADSLHELSRRVPIGGWGRIVLQTVLLAEQRGQTFAGRVILDRLHALVSERDARSILVEISLGVFVESSDGLPSIWRESFFSGSVNAEQSRMLKKTRNAGWLRKENLLVLRHASDDLYRRARAREDVGIAPDQMAASCHWMDLLLRALDADSGAQLLDQIAEDVADGNEEVRVRALGRYDCLAWACLIGMELPCSAVRLDALRPRTFAPVRQAAQQELTNAGAAYAECARFAWVFGAGFAPLDDDAWERIRAAAAHVIEGASGDDAEQLERRIAAYQALGACTLHAMDVADATSAMEDSPSAIPPQGGTPACSEAAHASPFAISAQAAARMEADQEAFLKLENGENLLYLTMAQVALGTLTRTQAEELILASLRLGNLNRLPRLIATLFTSDRAKPHIAGGHGPIPESEAPLAQRDPEKAAELRQRWQRCLEKLLL